MAKQHPSPPAQTTRRRSRKERLRRYLANNITQSFAAVASNPQNNSQKDEGAGNVAGATSQLSRVVRVYTRGEAIFPATKLDLASADNKTTKVNFGGPMKTLRSEVFMDLSRDVLYFDIGDCLSLIFTTVMSATNSPEVENPPIRRVAVPLTEFSATRLLVIWMAVDNKFLERFFIVCGAEELRSYVEDVPSDEFGFRSISLSKVEALFPGTRAFRENVFDIFTRGNPDLECALVFDWEKRGCSQT